MKNTQFKNSFKKIEKGMLIIAAGIAMILPMHSLISLAEEPLKTEQSQPAISNELIPFTDYDQEKLDQQNKSSRFLNRIKQEISSNQDDLLKINRNVESTTDKIEDAQEKIGTLQDQLNNLDGKIKNSQETIENVGIQITKKQADIETLQYQIEQKKTAISFQKQMLAEYLKDIFKDRANFNDLNDQGGDLNTLKLLLSDGSAGDSLRALRFSEVLEIKGRDIFEKLNSLVDSQETDQKILEIKKRTLQIYNNKLKEQQAELKVEKQAKANLLEQTRGEQSIYEELLKQTKADQEEVLLEMDTLRKNMVFVQERMKKLGNQFNPDDYANLLNISKGNDLKDYLSDANGTGFAPRWPVNPARGISAYYREAAYVKVFNMQHNAVDIPTAQSTPIKAPADGFVYKAKDNGYGYSYIMLAHSNGFMTLYGHVSEILVHEGQEIKAGDVIGLSGATPGTKGAGLYTTGPHLHFEVFKNGEHVDPLDYLNLAFLRLDSLPEKYVAKAMGDREKVRRQTEKVRVKKTDSSLDQNIDNTQPVNDLNSISEDPDQEFIGQ